VFESSTLEWPPPPVIVPPEEVIDCLVEDWPGAAEPVRWSEYVPDGLLADVLAQPAETGPEPRESRSWSGWGDGSGSSPGLRPGSSGK
jgi:hypothetical protein